MCLDESSLFELVLVEHMPISAEECKKDLQARGFSDECSYATDTQESGTRFWFSRKIQDVIYVDSCRNNA